jgi:ribonuclease-3
MSKYLYNTISFDEGVLTKRRAQLVCETALNIYASKIGFNKYLYLGVGEEAMGGRERPAIIADAMEAVLGAIFLDGGFIPASEVVFRLFIPYIDEAILNKDYKSILQEKLQSEKRSIHYEIVKETGIPNNKTFEAVVYMDNILMGKGKGKSKKEAEMAAAKDALEKEAR